MYLSLVKFLCSCFFTFSLCYHACLANVINQKSCVSPRQLGPVTRAWSQSLVSWVAVRQISAMVDVSTSQSSQTPSYIMIVPLVCDHIMIIPMTHAPETDAINRLHFSGAGFWYVCHPNLEPDSSGTRFRFAVTLWPYGLIGSRLA